MACAAEEAAAVFWSEAAALHAHSACLEVVAWAPDGLRLATGSADATVRVWAQGGSDNSWEVVLIFAGHSGVIRALAWSPDGRKLLSGSADKTARIWDARSEPELAWGL
ncbi:unnamed protein product [Polarella glacialis]|uniref:Uncharacterized protein n=1 Tax=Polarella glacialis TaxID=89957 RepID=A0A813FVI1_POLGL|nr:unnamed protein product [Polarella glacialis]